MTIEQIIQKAQEDGYMPDRSLPDIFLDPAFWQALGKAFGWDTTGEFEMTPLHERYTIKGHGSLGRIIHMPYWQFQWHCFIDALADGQSPEQFFSQF